MVEGRASDVPASEKQENVAANNAQQARQRTFYETDPSLGDQHAGGNAGQVLAGKCPKGEKKKLG
jgi:hypothetical protein